MVEMMQGLRALAPMVVAQATDAADAQGYGTLINMVPFALMFIIIYFLMLRPANQQRQQQQQLLQGLKKDDEVVTSSGLLGRIVALDDKLVTLELGDRVKVRMLRDRIAGPYKAEPAAAGQKGR